ncbi:cytochrome c oxidase subunit 8B, mitochondrial [Hemiscyllium ocellatum]|uniref:cytochrome c oxidase subunit 8B, mitochondrial n=1 Tax=Hemiscyllium ocellatum TaxID=170820 RepID=UPI002966EAAF|nr:cytochrome c oxidase subunit 8B, mitochondrial [Hemiscyllium ocellatum]
MQGLKRPLTQGLRFLIAGNRQQLLPRARIVSKPAKNELTSTEQIIGFTVLTASIMIPSSWILAHMEDYKHRPEPANN